MDQNGIQFKLTVLYFPTLSILFPTLKFRGVEDMKHTLFRTVTFASLPHRAGSPLVCDLARSAASE